MPFVIILGGDVGHLGELGRLALDAGDLEFAFPAIDHLGGLQHWAVIGEVDHNCPRSHHDLVVGEGHAEADRGLLRFGVTIMNGDQVFLGTDRLVGRLHPQ